MRKSLLEKELGFYDVSIHGVDLSLPWQISPSDLAELTQDPIKWKRRWLWRGQVTPLLRAAYQGVMGVYIAIILLATITPLVLTVAQWVLI